MAWRIVKQPNGRFARFSEVVDDFTHMHMTESEAEELCRHYPGMGRVEAEEKVRRAKEDQPGRDGSPRAGDGLDRWREALDVIESVHGRETRIAREREASAP